MTDTDRPPAPPAGRPTAPAGLRAAGTVLLVEALLVVGYGLAEASQARPGRLVVGIGAGLLLLGYGVLLAAVGRGLLRIRRWARGPAVATQLIHLPVAWSFRDGATWWVALLLAATAVVVLVGALLPSSTAALTPPAGPDAGPGSGSDQSS